MRTPQPHVKPRRNDSRHSLKHWLAGHRQLALTAFARLIATPFSSAMTVFVVAIALLLPSLMFGLGANLQAVLDGYQQQTRITLYLEDRTTDEEALQVSEYLHTLSEVAIVDYVSRQQALAEFSQVAGFGSILSELPENPLPASLLITPTSADSEQVTALAARLAELPEVALAQLDSEWLLRLNAIANLVSVLGSALSLIVVLGLFAIVGNTIKLAIENRKQEILVIKLVGGTDRFIARPFLYSGLLFGAAGGLLAVGMQTLILLSLGQPLQQLLNLYDSSFQLQGFSLSGALWMVLAGTLIGWGAALFASLRYILAINP